MDKADKEVLSQIASSKERFILEKDIAPVTQHRAQALGGLGYLHKFKYKGFDAFALTQKGEDALKGLLESNWNYLLAHWKEIVILLCTVAGLGFALVDWFSKNY